MAITKILARRGGLKAGIAYVMNGDKTEEQLLVTTHLCSKESAYAEMMATKKRYGKTNGVQCYHLVQSFQPGEVTAELAMDIAQAFVDEHLSDYEAVIGVHVDRQHIHAHIIFNSVNWQTGEKYHSNARTYYSQIRAISDRLCREHGLSVIMQGETSKSMSYIEWLRQSKGQPTYRSMLEADLKIAMEDANGLGHFFLLMEDMGYEIKHGNRLGFRLYGQEHFMYPERRNAQYSEEGIHNYITGNLAEITAGRKPMTVYREPYRPYKKHPKYNGFLALYVHYLYVLGKIQKQQYPPRMTPQLKQDIMRFEQLRVQFQFLHKHGIETESQMKAFQTSLDEKLSAQTKQRTILNVQKKKRKALFDALTTEKVLAPARKLHESGELNLSEEYARYTAAVALLDQCGIPREQLVREKTELYEKLADLNREIRQTRRDIAMCKTIQQETPNIQKQLHHAGLEQSNENRRKNREQTYEWR